MFRCFYNTILFSLHETSNLHFTPLHLSKASHCRSHRPPPPPPRWDLARRHVLCISYCDSHLVLKWNSRLIIPTLWFCRGAGAVLSRSYTSNNLKRRSKQAHLIDHKISVYLMSAKAKSKKALDAGKLGLSEWFDYIINRNSFMK